MHPVHFVHRDSLRPSYAPGAMTSAIINLDKLLTSHDSLTRVRSQLLAAERGSGISDLHKNSILILKKSGARLVHTQGHLSEVVAFAISPNGRHLATGSWVNDDYERGGMILIWDIEMGRCVNVLDPVKGGVGWPEYPNCIAWTNDGQKLGVAFNTNSVGLFDPFGENTGECLTWADVTDGWSRPPAFCMLPNGNQAYVACWQGADVPGALVSFEVKAKKKPKPSKTVRAMAKKIPAPIAEKFENEALQPAKSLVVSADGERVFCINAHSRAYAINLKTGELDYVAKIGLPAAYSPDGRYLAHTHPGLVIYDGNTGLPTLNLPLHMGMNALHWAKNGTGLRLAGVVSESNDFNAEPGVHIYDDNVYRYSIDVKPREPSWDDGDFAAFAWAPSGQRAAVLDEEGRLHIVTLGEKVVVERVVPMKEGLRGVFWAHPEGSSRDVIILASRQNLVFVDAHTGAVTAEHTFMQAPGTARPLDTGEMDLADSLRPDPTFAIDEESWGAVFPEGLVIAPSEKRDKVDAHLAWCVDRRHAWPARWGGIHWVENAAEVVDSPLQPAGVKWKKFKPAKSKKAPPAFPPPNPKTNAPLYEAIVKSIEDLKRGWEYHSSENLLHASTLRARRGEITEALAMAEKIPSYPVMLCASARIAAIAYRNGRGNEAEEALTFVDEEIAAEASDDQPNHEVLAYSIAMLSAWAAKKDQAQSDAWLARAKAKLEPEVNAWEYRSALIWALVEAGRDDDARSLFSEKSPWKLEPLCFYSIPFCVALVREGRVDMLFEFLEAWKKHRLGDIDWSLRDKLGQALAYYGAPERLEEGKRRFGLVVDEERTALANARKSTGVVLPSPSPADIETLAHDFAELQKTPRARRAGGTRALIEKAARFGHIGAVLALLPDLDATNFNDRPTVAFNALWTITTGFDIAPW